MIELMEHNVRPFKAISDAFQNGMKNVIYVSGVGTGKTFVFMALAESLFSEERILYVLPKKVIENNTRHYMEFDQIDKHVDFTTYNAMQTIHKAEEICSKYKLVVIDECHHLGSDLYGKNLLKAMETTDTCFLGLTATPIRSDKTDVRSYFDLFVNGISNFEAIRLGLMPPIDYRICLPEYDKKEIERESEGNERGVLVFDNAKEVIGKTLKAYPKDKWICYFQDISAIHRYRKLIENLFPDYHIFELYSSLNNLDRTIEGVKTSKRAVILSCNILLEGVHLEEIGGIILFRNVTSVNVLQQIIGRVCSVGTAKSPIIIDCAASAAALVKKLDVVNTVQIKVSGRTKGDNPKEIVRIGLSDEKEFNINDFLRYMVPGRGIVIKKIPLILNKYMELGGEPFDSVLTLDRNGISYQKLRACCRMYGITMEQFVEREPAYREIIEGTSCQIAS